MQYATVGETADRLAQVAVGLPPVPPAPHPAHLNSRTRDASYGPLQVNRYGSLAAWWDAGGYTLDVMSTPEGAVAAAAVLFHSCGWMPWQPPYGCDGDYLQTPAPVWGGS